MENKKHYTRILVGGILILLGLFFLADNFNLIDIHLPNYFFSIPSLVILFGIVIMINSERLGFGFSVTLFGIIWLSTKFIPGVGFGDIFIPFIILMVGFRLLFKSSDKDFVNRLKFRKTPTEISEDRINDIAIFGGTNKQFVSNNFKGGEITAIFGGSEIDLTDCKLASGPQFIDVVCCFGGTTLIVPKEWNIRIDIVPIFGGFTHKGKKTVSSVPLDENILTIKGLAIFGGGEIKSY